MAAIPGVKTNTGNMYRDELSETTLVTANANYEIVDASLIEMTKVVDKPGEAYFSGDTITFTINVTNNSTAALNGLVFKDTIDASVVPLTGTEYEVTATKGTISSKTSPISVTNIDLAADEDVTITISGKID